MSHKASNLPNDRLVQKVPMCLRNFLPKDKLNLCPIVYELGLHLFP